MSFPFLVIDRAGQAGLSVKCSPCKHKSQRSDSQHRGRAGCGGGAGGSDVPRSREPVLVLFLVAATKYLIEAVSRRGVFFDSLRVLPAMAGTSQQQKHGAAGRIQSGSRGRQTLVLRTAVHEMVPPTFRVGLPASTHLI